MRIRNIKKVGRKPVYDISVADAEHYVLENGVITHNTGIYYSADTIWIIGRQQDKEGTEVLGYNFIITIEKSRFVKEKSKLPIMVSWKGGIERYSGLLDVAVEGGYVIKPKNGWYTAIDPLKYVAEVKDPRTKKVITPAIGTISKNLREKDTLNKEFWDTIFSETDFSRYITDKYSVGHISMLAQKPIENTDESEDDSEVHDETISE